LIRRSLVNHVGVSRPFRAAAYLRVDASPNEESTLKCTPVRQARRKREPGRAGVNRHTMSFRLAASVLAAALLHGCGAPKSGEPAAGTARTPAATAAVTVAPTPAGPPNAPAAQAGRPGAIPLDGAQRRELAATVAKVPAAKRARLRYALAAGDDGRRHLVVYEGEDVAAAGRQPGKTKGYVVFMVLNAHNGEHYDPQQNSIVPPIPPPVQRDNAISR
jgi:hypothetical protein